MEHCQYYWYFSYLGFLQVVLCFLTDFKTCTVEYGCILHRYVICSVYRYVIYSVYRHVIYSVYRHVICSVYRYVIYTVYRYVIYSVYTIRNLQRV